MHEQLPLMSIVASTGNINLFAGWNLTGEFTTLDLIAASTNALNGALLARRPDHYKQFTVVGILAMAVLGGIGGGVSRDILLGQVPDALLNPAYVVACLIFGIVGYQLAYAKGQLFREGIFQFATSFSLSWYAIVGAQKGVDHGLPVLSCLLLAVVGPTAGRFMIDLTCGLTPKQFIRGEWFLGAALYRGWEEPLAPAPQGLMVHDDRPLLGRKLKGRSLAELHDLGLTMYDADDQRNAAN